MVDLAGPRARVQARLMTDACTITHTTVAVPGVFNPDTMTRTTVAPTTLYDGPCHFSRTPSLTLTDGRSGGVESTDEAPEVHIPFDAPVIPKGSVVVITASEDGVAVGERYTVQSTSGGTTKVWRTLLCTRTVQGTAVQR